MLAKKHRAPTPRPLFNQPGLMENQHVVLVEGEKAAEALMTHGITATTAMNGAKAPPEKDWSPLKGKHLLIWPVMMKLAALMPRPSAHIWARKGILPHSPFWMYQVISPRNGTQPMLCLRAWTYALLLLRASKPKKPPSPLYLPSRLGIFWMTHRQCRKI